MTHVKINHFLQILFQSVDLSVFNYPHLQGLSELKITELINTHVLNRYCEVFFILRSGRWSIRLE